MPIPVPPTEVVAIPFTSKLDSMATVFQIAQNMFARAFQLVICYNNNPVLGETDDINIQLEQMTFQTIIQIDHH